MTQIRQFYDSWSAENDVNAWLKKHPTIKVINTTVTRAPLSGGETITLTFESDKEINRWE